MKQLLLTLLLGAVAPALLLAQAAKTPSAPIQGKYTGVEIVPFDAEKELKVLPEFRVALYENLVDQVSKSHKFDQVYREGVLKAPTPGVIRVRGTVLAFKKGSEQLRDLTTVLGWTSIKVHIRLEDQATGALLAEKDFVGRVRFFRDNLRATLSLAKQTSKLLGQTIVTKRQTRQAARAPLFSESLWS